MKISQREDTNLIVLSAHGSACDSARSFGSVTTYLFTHSTVPLLVLQDLPGRDGHRANGVDGVHFDAPSASKLRAGAGVTAVAVSAASANATEPAGLEAEARALAEAQHGFKRVARLLTRVFAPPPLARPLERAERFLSARSSGDAALERATEWFLDNYYLIRRVARQVEEELPRGFVRHLPQLASGRPEGKLRIDALAHLLVEKSDMMLDISVLHRFVGAYQEVSPLTIAELWALPTMLRATVLEELLQSPS